MSFQKRGEESAARPETRSVWVWAWLERLWQDLRYARRMLAKNPGFTMVAVLSLGIGIGANSAMFSLADALLLRPLPVLRPSEVVTVASHSTNTSFIVDRLGWLSYREYLDYRANSKSFKGLVAFHLDTFGFSPAPDALPHMRMGMLVTGDFFRVMGVEPELGRSFRPDEDQVEGRDAVVVLGHDFWEKEFAADRSMIGRKVRLNGTDFTVIGIAPAPFTGMDTIVRPAFFVPVMMWRRIASSSGSNMLEARDQRVFTVKGRLRPGVTMAQAQAELGVIAKSLERTYPVTNRNQSVVLRTELEARFNQGQENVRLIGLLIGLSLTVLLVACANVACLLLSRARVRSREISMRLAIGAGRPRLIRQLLTESLLIALAGGVLGLGVASVGVAFFNRLTFESDLPVVLSVQLDQRVMLVSLILSLASTLVFGLTPAVQTTRTDLASALRTAGADAPGRKRLWGRNLLVVGQVAMSLLLLTVATLVFQAFRNDMAQGPGFRTDHRLLMSFDPRLIRYTDQQTKQFFQQVVERARAVAGVKSAALTYVTPMDGATLDGATILPEGYRYPPGQENVNLFSNTVDENYFRTLGVPIVRGRGFRTSDTAATPRVAVVNEELAKHYWPGQDPIGKRFRLDNQNGPWVEIVGVAKQGKYFWVGEPPSEFLYFPLAQKPEPRMTLVAESFGDPAALATPLREVVRNLDANQPVYDVRVMEEYFQNRAMAGPNLIIQTVAAIGVMGLVLAMVGLYGLVAYSASRRTREIGIRMAIGAPRGAVLRMVMRQGLVLGLSGVAVGLAASYGIAKVLTRVMAGMDADASAFLLVAPALLVVTMLAAYIPARRASMVDPMKALHYD
ncbi:MAG TPA: ABC transporter permease [Bryobacteraceae bacterium]|nr:ABC transporter permease [Bryobacteraceae bacterium]